MDRGIGALQKTRIVSGWGPLEEIYDICVHVISVSNPDASYHRALAMKTPLEKTCAMNLWR
jgi:hypothetical protein